MSDRIEWVDADAAEVDWTTVAGELTDAYGSVNDGPAVTFGSIIMEGTVEELRDFGVRFMEAVDQIEQDLLEDEDD